MEGSISSNTDADLFRSFLEFAPDGIVVIDEDGLIRHVNAQTETLFGYGRDELLGQPVEMLLPERFRGAHEDHRRGFLADPRTRSMGEGLALFGQRRDGSEFPVDISLAPLATADGVLIMAAIRDVTERKRLESMRDEFIANAAHELRTPLATLATLSETLATHLHRMTPEQLSDSLAALKRQGERASRLVSNLLDLSQIESGRITLAIRSVPLAASIRRALDAAPPPEGIEIEVRVDEDLTVLADEIRFGQVVTNLLTNAYRYGGHHVQVTAQLQGETVLLSVVDDGPGVPDDLIDVLFEPFTRGRDSSTVGGSGIGLAICRALAQAFDGDIRYEDADPGARFILSFPRVAV